MSKKTKYIFTTFIIIGIVFQFIIPATMIFHQEEILRKGARVYFETGAVDPLDVFCGRYVDLNLAEFNLQWDDKRWEGFANGWWYAVIQTNEQGVATITNLEATLPEGEDILYFRVKKYWRWLESPFKKFYMPEKLAPVAEDIYREMAPRRGQETTNSVLLAVRIYDGKTAVEDLLVNGTPMIHAAQERLKEKQGKR